MTESESGLREQLGGLAKDGLLKVASEPEGQEGADESGCLHRCLE